MRVGADTRAIATGVLLLLATAYLGAEAVDGVIDLRGTDLAEPVFLDGGWHFAWDRLIVSPPEEGDDPDVEWTSVEVPSRFNEPSGYATYRLTVLVDERESLALYLPPLDTAFRVYVDGVDVGGNGRVGTLPGQVEIEEYSPLVIEIPDGAPRLELTFHLASFVYPRSGLDAHVSLGTKDSLLRRSRGETAFDMTLFGVLVIMALYHLIVYLFRTDDRAPLAFALLCSLIALRLLVTGDGYLYRISSITWVAGTRIEYLTWYLGLLTFVALTHLMFRTVSLRNIAIALAGSCLALSIPAIVTGIGFFTRTIQIANLLTGATAVFAITIGIRATARKDRTALYFFAGALLLTIAVANDVLYAYNLIRTRYLAPAGITLFAIAQAFSLARRHADAFLEVERLGKKLSELNTGLEEKVFERTRRLEAAYTEIRELSERDGLTGCFNRGYLESTIRREMAKAARYGRRLSIALGDLDDFKRVNDEHGHLEGDEVLKRFVRTVELHIRDRVDWIARYGGEEFAIVLPETDSAGAAVLAERIRSAFAETRHEIDGTRLTVTVSFGVATSIPEMGSGPEAVDDLIGRADRELYRAKHGGKNRVSIEEQHDSQSGNG